MTESGNRRRGESAKKNGCFAGASVRRIAVSIFLLIAGRLAYASGEPDAFAINGVGARQGGMGGAFIGLSDDIESVYYNPAGLGNLKTAGFTTMYQTPSIETSRGFLAFNKAWDDSVL